MAGGANSEPNVNQSRPRFWRSLIGRRLFLYILAFSSIVTFTVTASDLYLEYRSGVSAIRGRLDQIELSYSASLGESLWNLDKRQIVLQLRGIVQLPDIRAVHLREISPTSSVNFSVQSDENQGSIAEIREIPISCLCGGSVRIIGSLRVETTHANLYRDIFRRALVILAGQAIKTFLVATFTLFVVHQLVTRHLLHLAGTLAGFSPGTTPPLRLRRNPRVHDEFDRVVDTFNAMAQRLERRDAELGTANSRMAAILDNIPDIAWVKAPDGKYIVVNRPFAALFDFADPADLAGKTDFDLFPSALAESNWRGDIEVMHTGLRNRSDDCHMRPDGSKVLMETIKSPLRDASGLIAGTVGISRDVTQRRATEERLRDTATRLEALIANVRATVFRSTYSVHGPRLAISFYGNGDGFGEPAVSAGPVAIDRYRQMVHPDDQDREFETIGQEFVRFGDVDRHCRMVTAGGKPRWLMVRERVVSRDGDILITEGLSIDISEEVETRRKLESVIGNLPGVAFRLHYRADGTKLMLFAQGSELNQSVVELGLKPHSFVERYHPDDYHSLFVEVPAKLRETGKAVHLFRVREDSDYRWVRSWERVVERIGGEIVTEGIALDVTEEILAKQAQESSERRYRDLVTALPVGVFEDETGKGCIYASDLWVQLTGLPMEEIVGTGWTKALHPDDAQQVAQRWQHACDTCTIYENEFRIRHVDGRETWVLARALPSIAPDGSRRGHIGSITDISDRKRMEEALRTSEESFRTLAENLPDLVVRLDHEARIVYATPSVCQTYARPLDEIIGRTVAELLPPEEDEQSQHLVAAVKRAFGQGTANGMEATWNTPVGAVIVDIRHVPERDAAGRVVSVLGIARDITKRKRAEEELRKTAVALDTVIANLPGTLFRFQYPAVGPKKLLLLDGAPFREHRQRAEALLAMSAEELTALYHPDDLHLLYDEVPARLRNNGFAEFTHRIRAADGTWQWGHTWERLVERDGDALITEGITLDVTDEMAAKRALERSERHFGDLVEALPVGIFENDLDTGWVFTSRLCHALAGLPPAELNGDGWLQAVASYDRTRVQKVWEDSLAAHAMFQSEFHLHNAVTGQDTWVLARALPRLDEDGRMLGYIGSLTDISERKAYEVSLERINHVLRTVAAGNEALMLTTDKASLFAAVCRILVEVGGYRMAWIGVAEHDPDKIVRPVAWAGQDAGYLARADIRWDDSPKGCGPTGTAVKTGLPQVADDVIGDRRMAPWRAEALPRDYRSSLALPLKGENGVIGCLTIYSFEPNGFGEEEVPALVDFANNIAFTVVAMRERRRRQEVEHHLQQAQKMEALGLLAGTVAHDFNNLLGAIQGFASFIAEDSGDGQASHYYAQRILTAGKRGKALIGQILAFSRQVDMKPELVALDELISETKALALASFPESTQIAVAADDDAITIVGDRDLLSQALINLCVNANDAIGGAAGTIWITCRTTDPNAAPFARMVATANLRTTTVWEDDEGTVHAVAGYVDLSHPCVSLVVADSGCGIPCATMERIFTPFFTTKQKEHGTGLGLTAVHRAISAHHGAILVESRLGQGTSFEIVLPRNAPPIMPLHDESPRRPSIVPNAVGRILLVDDDPDFGDMLLTALERRGFDVSPCADPLEALTGLKEFPQAWDALVTDQTMPNMSGLELARAAKGLQPELPCILCTGFAEDTLDDATLAAAGVTALLRKPINIDELVEKLVQHIPQQDKPTV
jgi:PAS domain S-box-containing protein